MFDFLKKKHSLAESGVLSGSVDAHSHILFEVDDGAKHQEDSLAILEYEESLGVTDVWCTPHVMEDVPNGTDKLKERFVQLQELYSGGIRLHLAAEYMMDNLFEERLRSRDLLCHGKNRLLVETTLNSPPYNLDGTLSLIRMAGMMPILAHPERYRYMDRDAYRAIAGTGVMLQLNLASLTGYYGKTAKAKAEWLLENGMYSMFGSDCHRLRAIIDQDSRKILRPSTVRNLAALSEKNTELNKQ